TDMGFWDKSLRIFKCLCDKATQMSLSRLNHRLPRGQTHLEIMQGTAEFHHQIAEGVSQVLMCYSPQVSLQPTIPNVIEWHHDSPGLALSSLSRDRHRAPWPDPARQATVPVPRTTLCGAYVPAGVELPRTIACSQRADRRDGPECEWDS